MTAGLETFAKVRRLHDSTTSPGEKASAAVRMRTLASKAGMTGATCAHRRHMGSKALPFSGPSSDASGRDEVRRLSSLRQENTERLLKRIAEAVQVPPSAFYRPPNAADAGTPAATNSATSVASGAECAELLAAFKLVSDPEDRRRLSELVRRMAERR